MKLAIVIPAYNEAATIGDVIRQILAVEMPGIEKEIIVVDDGSSDQTAAIARSEGAVPIRHLVNRGVGGALATGIETALRRDADWIVTCDADGQHSPSDIMRLIEPIRSGLADVVIGSRMADPGGMPWTRRIANRLANVITSVLFGIRTTDSQSGLRAFSRSAARRIRITANRYEALSEIIAEIHRHRLRLMEVPIRVIYTDYSLSKGQGFGVGLKTLFRLLLSKFLRQP
jgi:glycosyltransferase involved in cell wall biosynthesis